LTTNLKITNVITSMFLNDDQPITTGGTSSSTDDREVTQDVMAPQPGDTDTSEDNTTAEEPGTEMGQDGK
jgi:hypothetical protein